MTEQHLGYDIEVVWETETNSWEYTITKDGEFQEGMFGFTTQEECLLNAKRWVENDIADEHVREMEDEVIDELVWEYETRP